MPESWIPVTLAAAFFQNLRSAVQKHLTGVLSGQGAAYSRFLFALPFALIYFLALIHFLDNPWPRPNSVFLIYCAAGSITQILATVFLLKTFSYRSFAVGTTYSKLEIVIVAILGAVLLDDLLSPLAQIGIGLSAVGLLILSAAQNRLSFGALLSGITEKSTVLGLAAALFLGASVIFFRGASLSLEYPSAWISASFTLLCALCIQTLLMGAYLLLAEPGEIGRVIRSWRWSALVGIAGMLASVGWFTAFTLQNASYVRALGQVELLFTLFATTRVFRERVNKQELAGGALILAGIILLLLN